MKVLKDILALFTNECWLKVISLLLAIIIFHSIKSDMSRNQDRNAQHDRPIFQQFR